MEQIRTNKAFLTLAILGIVLTVLSMARSSEPVDPDAYASATMDRVYELEMDAQRVDRGIRFLLRRSPCWGIAADSKERREMAEQIVKAAAAFDVPPLLLAVTVKRESSFQSDAIGVSNGEIGLSQVHGLAARRCDLSTVAGQLECGARWLRKAHDKCGDWTGGVMAYMSGRCKAKRGGRLHKAVQSRVDAWRKVEAATASCAGPDAFDERVNRYHWLCKPPINTCVARVREIERAARR